MVGEDNAGMIWELYGLKTNPFTTAQWLPIFRKPKNLNSVGDTRCFSNVPIMAVNRTVDSVLFKMQELESGGESVTGRVNLKDGGWDC
jgi:hypothetical protein